MTTTTQPHNTDPVLAIGTPLDGGMTAAEALAAAGLTGWNVRKAPVQTITEDGIFEVPGHYAIVRNDPTTGLVQPLCDGKTGGMVGNVFVPIQNEDNADVLSYITGEYGARFTAGGQLQGGKRTFLSMQMPETLLIGGVDPLTMNIVGFNSHDGSSAFHLATTPVRVWCANQQRAVIKGAHTHFSIHHTKNAQDRIRQVRIAMLDTLAYTKAFKAEADALLGAPMSTNQFVTKIVGEMWQVDPDAKTSRAATMNTNRLDELVRLFTVAETNALIRGTAWCGYQAITEYLDHTQPVRAKGSPEAARAERTLLGRNDGVKAQAFARIAEFAAA